MNETLLLFHAPSRPELLKIQRALLPLHIRLRCISQKDYLQPLGFLAGMKNFSPTTEVYDGEELSAPLFLFCFFRITDLIRHLLPSDAAVLVHFLIKRSSHQQIVNGMLSPASTK